MDNVINLFDGSPRLSNNIFPRKKYGAVKILYLRNALAKREIIELMEKSKETTVEELAGINIILEASQVSPELLMQIRSCEQ